MQPELRPRDLDQVLRHAVNRKWMEGITSHDPAGSREPRVPPGQKPPSNSGSGTMNGINRSNGTAAVNDETSPISPVTSPPYWMQSHQRSVSNISIESIPTGAITLQDNTDGEDVKNKACWAKSVYIEGHVVVNGNRTGIGSFVVWNINVETLRVRLLFLPYIQITQKVHFPLMLFRSPCRAARCVSASATPNSTTSATDSSRPSPTLKPPCPLCLPRA